MSIKLDSFVGFAVTPPLMSKQLFAQWQGVTEDTVRGWVETKTIPSIKVGRKRMINVVLLYRDMANGKTHFETGSYRDYY